MVPLLQHNLLVAVLHIVAVLRCIDVQESILVEKAASVEAYRHVVIGGQHHSCAVARNASFLPCFTVGVAVFVCIAGAFVAIVGLYRIVFVHFRHNFCHAEWESHELRIVLLHVALHGIAHQANLIAVATQTGMVFEKYEARIEPLILVAAV